MFRIGVKSTRKVRVRKEYKMMRELERTFIQRLFGYNKDTRIRFSEGRRAMIYALFIEEYERYADHNRIEKKKRVIEKCFKDSRALSDYICFNYRENDLVLTIERYQGTGTEYQYIYRIEFDGIFPKGA